MNSVPQGYILIAESVLRELIGDEQFGLLKEQCRFTVSRQDYYILVKETAVFVKEAAFFVSQGGLTQEWGRSWECVEAESMGDARMIGEERRQMRRWPQ